MKKYELLELQVQYVEEDVITEITELLQTLEKVDFPENVFVSIESLINIFDERRDSVLMLFDKNYSVSFITKISKIYSDFNFKYFCRYHNNDRKIKYDFFYMFLSSGFYGIIKYWLENPDLMSKEDLVDLTYTLIKRLLVKDNPNIIDIISM